MGVLITNHVVAGAAIGALAPGPVSAFGLGIASHAAMDSVAHWGDPDHQVFLKVAVVDGLVGLTVLGHLARHTPRERRTNVVAGMLGACFPDSDKPGLLFFGRSPFPAAVDAWHKKIQRESADRMRHEIATAALGLLVARRLVRRAAR